MMDMKLRIWKEKLMLILHIRSLNDETLAKKIYNEQRKQGWPGLAKETKNICEVLGVEDVNTTQMNKNEYKKSVNGALKIKDEEYLRKEAESKRKCEKIMMENYGKKEYIGKRKVGEVRNIFKARVGMTEFADNFGKDKRFLRTKWMCRCGDERESENHIMKECPIYEDIRMQYEDLKDDMQLAHFFTKERIARRRTARRRKAIWWQQPPMLQLCRVGGSRSFSANYLIDNTSLKYISWSAQL